MICYKIKLVQRSGLLNKNFGNYWNYFKLTFSDLQGNEKNLNVWRFFCYLSS